MLKAFEAVQQKQEIKHDHCASEEVSIKLFIIIPDRLILPIVVNIVNIGDQDQNSGR